MAGITRRIVIMVSIDKISLERIALLHPKIRQDVTAILLSCYNKNVPIRITQGYRTFADQDSLYAQGRTKNGAIVTNAAAGQSWHNYGLAFDFCLLLNDGKNVSWDREILIPNSNTDEWDTVVAIAKSYGFEWGGDWEPDSKKDFDHFQKTFGLTLECALNRYKFDDIDKDGYINI